MKTPEGMEAIQTNGEGSGMSFSIGLAEYSVALFMHTVVVKAAKEINPAEVTIIAPNTL